MAGRIVGWRSALPVVDGESSAEVSRPRIGEAPWPRPRRCRGPAAHSARSRTPSHAHPVDVRAHLVAALEADLVGAFYPEDRAGPRDDLLSIAPSRRYLTGLLAPHGSNDPVCAAHSPEKELAARDLEGAAFHGCLQLAECSCERFNRHLDRSLVVPTLGRDPALAGFGQRP